MFGRFFTFLVCQPLVSLAGGSPVSGDGASRGLSVLGIVMFSAVVLISLIMLLLVCLEGNGCWPLRYFRRDAVAAISMDNPLADSGGGMGLSEIDVRALELDPIVFEPLPTLSDLTPARRNSERQSVQYHLNGKYFGAIVPLSSHESHIYAHDWFDEPFRNFPRGNIEYIRELGKGWFGQVIEGEARDIVPYAKKMRVIVKVLRGDACDAEQMRFLDESRLYRDGNHGNILKLLGHSIETNPFLLLLEYCALGDLKSYLISNVSRAEVLNSRGDVLRMVLDVAKGLEWMATSDFTHGDLAARNCQVGSEGRILIGDYGLSTETFKDDYYWSSNIAIPLRWAAPETLHCTINTIQTLKVTKEANIWTFGVLLWEISEFGKLPYFELSDEQVISRVFCDKSYRLGGPTMPSLVQGDELYSLMTACWSSDPARRPPITSIVQRLQLLTQRLETQSTKKADDFDTKWEHALSQTKKKSVSFSGDPSEAPLLPTVKFALSTPVTPLTAPSAVPFAKTQIPFETRVDPFPSLDLWKPLDPEEEDYKMRIERGEITQKVREKSESVQDLMILTHLDPGDFSEGESLVILDPSPPGILRRTSSETAISQAGKSSSQAPKISTFLLPIPCIAANNGPTPISKTGINNHLTAPTPSPGIAINIIQPTPIPKEPPEPELDGISSQPPVFKSHAIKRRFVFRDDDDDAPAPQHQPGFQSVRHASTPYKSPSPVDSSISEESDVFNSPRSVAGDEDRTCDISPISKAESVDTTIQSTTAVEVGSNNTNAYIVSVFGAVDDLGLSPFQCVTTTVAIPTSPELKRNIVPKKLVFEQPVSNSGASNDSESWLIYTKVDGNEGFAPKEKESLKANFQEEIAVASEELGSLRYQDLEEDDGEYKLIKENRDEEEEGLITSRLTRNAFGGEVGEESLSLSPTFDEPPPQPVPFVPSKWDSTLNPAKSAIKSPEPVALVKEPCSSGGGAGIRKSVSFERKKRQLVYEYPPHPTHTDSEDEDTGNPLTLSGPLALSLDWELNPDEMDGVVEEDWELEAAGEPKTVNKLDVYRISPFASSEGDSVGAATCVETIAAAAVVASTVGALRHARDKLTLDLGRHSGTNASNSSWNLENNPPKLVDSGVGGSSTNIASPLCDNPPTPDSDQEEQTK